MSTKRKEAKEKTRARPAREGWSYKQDAIFRTVREMALLLWMSGASPRTGDFQRAISLWSAGSLGPQREWQGPGSGLLDLFWRRAGD